MNKINGWDTAQSLKIRSNGEFVAHVRSKNPEAAFTDDSDPGAPPLVLKITLENKVLHITRPVIGPNYRIVID